MNNSIFKNLWKDENIVEYKHKNQYRNKLKQLIKKIAIKVG